MLTNIIPLLQSNHQTGCECQGCSGFDRAEHLSDVPEKDVPFSNILIHPIFGVAEFCNDSDIFRPILMQSLRLCTLLLDVSLPFYHTIFFGDVVVLREGNGELNKQLLFINEHTELTSAEKQATRAKLQELRGRIIFELDSEPHCSGCRVEKNEKTGETRAIISINRNHYEQVKHIFWKGTDAVHEAYVQVYTAGAIMHEVAHAFMDLTHGQGVEAYFEGSRVAEEGYEWEVRTFGGVLSEIFKQETAGPRYRVEGYPSRLKGMVVLSEWPNKTIVKEYQSEAWVIGAMGELPDTHIKWNTDMSHFFNLLQSSWWRTEYAHRGPQALRFTKKTGYRFITDEAGKSVAYNDPKNKEIHGTIPEGFQTNSNNLIVPRHSQTGLLHMPSAGSLAPLPTGHEIAMVILKDWASLLKIYAVFAFRVKGRANQFFDRLSQVAEFDSTTGLCVPKAKIK